MGSVVNYEVLVADDETGFEWISVDIFENEVPDHSFVVDTTVNGEDMAIIGRTLTPLLYNSNCDYNRPIPADGNSMIQIVGEIPDGNLSFCLCVPYRGGIYIQFL